MSTTVGYEWRLRDQMAAAGMFSTTKLIPLLQARGVNLSSSQVYRLVTDTPERLNLSVLVALMDILECSADDLIAKVDLGHARAAEAANGTRDSASTAIRERGLRPRPARLSE